MTYVEMYNHLEADSGKIEYKKGYYLRKAVAEFKKEKKFPSWKLYEYITPTTNNKYIIFFYARSRSFIENPIVDSFCIMYDYKNKKRFVVKCSKGAYVHTENSPLSIIKQIHVFSSHFIERYNERFLKDKSFNANEVICRFLSRNKEFTPILLNEDINKNLENYGSGTKYGYRVRDGFCFTKSEAEGIISEDGNWHKDKIEAILCLYTTFMNESDMAEVQLLAIDKEHCKTMAQFGHAIKRELLNDPEE